MLNKKGANLLASTFLAAVTGFAGLTAAWADTVEYKFDIVEKNINYTGQNVTALTISGSIPAPTIEANEGDILRPTFCNKLDTESSVHWHGVELRHKQDGVPYLNSPPIQPRTCYTYEFPIHQHGTYWYHSHSDMQEQRGVYGAIIFHPKDGERDYADHDRVLVLSDWKDQRPAEVMQRLKRDGEFYSWYKDTVPSLQKTFEAGWKPFRENIGRFGVGMMMDVSDIAYDAFLANGEKTFRMAEADHGDKVRLRLINAASSSFFHVQFAGGPMKVVAKDGQDIKPYKADRFLMGVGETYDVIVAMPHDGRAYEFRATAQDGTGFSSTILGASKEIVKAPEVPKINPVLRGHVMIGSGVGHAGHADHTAHGAGPTDHTTMDHSNMNHAGHANHNVQADDIPSYGVVQGIGTVCPLQDTSLDPGRPWQEIELNMTGTMDGYYWSFNGKMFAEAELLKITRGHNVRITMKNETMMAHTFHKHGVLFRVVNKENPSCSPMMHTILLRPGESAQMEFYASEAGNWLAHCHIAHHMMAGMSRIISYEGTPHNRDIAHLHHDNETYFTGEIGAMSHMYYGEMWLRRGRHALFTEFDADIPRLKSGKEHYDIDIHAETYITTWKGINVSAFVGGDFDRDPLDKAEDEHSRYRAVAGFHVDTPLIWSTVNLGTLRSEFRSDHTGHTRAEFKLDIPLTKNIELHLKGNTDKEGRAIIGYTPDTILGHPNKDRRWTFTAGWDSDFSKQNGRGASLGGVGIGIRFNF